MSTIINKCRPGKDFVLGIHPNHFQNKMKICIENADNLATILAVAKEFSDYITFTVANSILRATILDATHVSVTVVRITATSDATVTFSVNTKEFASIIALGNEALEMVIEADSINLSMGKIQAKLRLFDIDTDDISVEGYEAPCKVTTSTKQFFSNVRDLATFGDTVKIHAKDDSIRLETSGDLGTVTIDLDAICDGAPPAPSSYALKYIISLAKAARLNDELRVSLGESMPMRIDIERNECGLSFYLAPKIQDDDDDD